MSNESWHLSKTVPVGIIIALILQFSSIIWFGAKLDSRTTTNAENIVKLESRVDKSEQMLRQIRDSVIRIEYALGIKK